MRIKFLLGIFAFICVCTLQIFVPKKFCVRLHWDSIIWAKSKPRVDEKLMGFFFLKQSQSKTCLRKKNVYFIKKLLVCLEFILNSREVFSCYEIHIINIYSGSKPIYCTRAYKLPKNVLFSSNPLEAQGSVVLIQTFGTQVRDEERFRVYKGACRSFCPSVQHCWWV